jgi:choline transport protein
MAYEMQPVKGFADSTVLAADTKSQADDRVHVDDRGMATGTDADVWDMARLGRKQELRRNFKSWSILGLATTTMSTWVAMLLSSVFSLINGGLAGTIWIYVASWLSVFAVAASLAEMSSMAPHSGGQYREFSTLRRRRQFLDGTDVQTTDWVSEFGPRSCSSFLSYLVGWLAALGWQAAVGITGECQMLEILT